MTSAIETMTPAEVAKLLRIDPSTLSRMIQRGKGPRFTRVTEHTVRYLRSDVEAYLRGEAS